MGGEEVHGGIDEEPPRTAPRSRVTPPPHPPAGERRVGERFWRTLTTTYTPCTLTYGGGADWVFEAVCQIPAIPCLVLAAWGTEREK